MKSLQGKLLIASPQLLDPNFAQAVVLIIQHAESGALGMILNRPLETDIQAVWDQVSQAPCFVNEPLHQGGPCEGPLMVLHDDATISDDEVVPGVRWTTDKDSIEQLVSQNAAKMRFFVGYAGWGEGQLEGELEAEAWIVLPASAELIFSPTEGLWNRLRRRSTLTTTYPWLDPKRIPDDPTTN